MSNIKKPDKIDYLATLDQKSTLGELIRDIKVEKNDLDAGIVQLLVKLMNGMQVTDKLTADEWRELGIYIKKYYRDLSLHDIDLAIELIIVQGYGDIDYSTYNRFSAQYVCRFLNLYRKLKAQKNIQKPTIAAHHKALPISKEASRETIIKIAEISYHDYCNRDFFSLINVEAVFSEMQKAGLATDWEKLNKMYLTRAEELANLQRLEPTGKTEKVQIGQVTDISALILGLPILNEIKVDGGILKLAKKLYIQDRFEFWKVQKREMIF